MKLNRRELLQSAAGLAVAAPARGAIDWNQVRNDFPWLKRKVWLSAADYHPIGIHSLRAIEGYLAYRVHGPGEGRSRFGNDQQRETKELFAKLIGAKSSEIAFVTSTTDAENLVVAGMGLGNTKGNVVIDELHYQASKFLYHMLQKEGRIELRIVQPRDWKIDPKDMDKAIDRNTKLVSLALVSNINGYLHDVKATSDIAHARGALVYADIIQGAGAIPIDVAAMGIDCAGCGAYKWLMGDMGFGFLFVREDLQDRVIKRSRYGVRQYSNPNGAQADSQFTLLPGAARYEVASSLPNCGGVCAHAALRYIHSLGIDNIRAHAKPLTDRLLKELPRMGYPSITPPGNPTPIVSFLTPEYEKTAAKLDKAFGEAVIAMRRWEFTSDQGEVRIVKGMRISPSVYNNQGDVDRLLEALS
ncbi:MAG: aminotransferase class V-fold PLP-dependent enzyme [Acidobacteria bacterium]|nr:aminotransferase class V-fold PLP-dependent enzyme [Acidobacteriota bacterium]